MNKRINFINKELYYACAEGNLELVQSLLKNGVNAACEITENSYEKGATTESPIHVAINAPKYSKEIIESLIQYGADINVKLDHLSKKCWQSFSPVQVAVSRNAGILALLLEHKANPNGQCEEKLFSYTFKDATIFFPIHTAVYQSNIEALSLLLSAGAIVDIIYKRKFKTEFEIENTDQTALHIACDIKKRIK